MNKQNLVALLAGVLFGFGLMLSGMANPQKVMNFLDLAGTWDPTLAFVMGGALLISVPAFHFVLKRPAAWTGAKFQLPTSKDIDPRLIAGAAIFGIGWGLSGYCPGPAIAALSFASANSLAIVLAMLVGIVIHDHVVSGLLKK